MKKRLIFIVSISVFLVLIIFAYIKYAAPTRIAVVSFPDFLMEKMERSSNNRFVSLDNISPDKLKRIDKYKLILVRGHGVRISGEQLDQLSNASEKGSKIFVADITNPEYDVTNLTGEELEYFTDLFENKCTANFCSLFNYARKEIEKKLFFNKPYSEAVILPDDFFFHQDNDQIFGTLKEYESWYRKSGFYKEGAPRVALLAGNINIQNSNPEHTVKLIQGLEKTGLNVYPIRSFGIKKMQLLKDCNPDMVILRPHGRLAIGQQDMAVKWLKEKNIPVLAPLTVFGEYDDWLKSQQGMYGGMLSMSVVMPELDGAVVPYAIVANFRGETGNLIFDAIPNRVEDFCHITANRLRLQKKKNAEKKIAVYYFKGPGQNSLVASNMEVVPSLYNLLKYLKEQGYDVDGLPADEEEFENLLMKKGPVLGTYALGAFDEYLKNGEPCLVNKDRYEQWCREAFPGELYRQVVEQYGEAPGNYMNVEKDGKEYIAVTRVQFGNVCLLPQPLPGTGDNAQQLVHGARTAPPHTYIASYLWSRYGFRADAIFHFGTHGSLEFTPGKQVALSCYDWPDRLIGNIPHFYIYTISNIGEGIIAKRRSYATLITYLTPPFMKSGLHDELNVLYQKMDKYNSLPSGPVKEQYAHSVKLLAESQNIHRAIGLDSTKEYSPADLHKLHEYLEEIEEEKVISGLYTMGVPYKEDKLRETVSLMALDPIAFGLAELDGLRGKIQPGRYQDIFYVSRHYHPWARNIIQELLDGQQAEVILNSVLTSAEREMAHTWDDQNKDTDMMSMMKAKDHSEEKGNIQGRTITEKEVRTDSIDNDMINRQNKTGISYKREERYAGAVLKVENSIRSVSRYYSSLSGSPEAEFLSVVNALNGGYTEPSPGGDPVVNPAALPTGRNMYSVNAEATPSEEAWIVGKRLAESLLEKELEAKGCYPQKISFTLWSTNFISTEGATIAQILYLLGVEPVRDGFGTVQSLRLIPVEEFKRPRIDVVVQTSGQLRDLAASRLALIHKAVAMAAEAEDADSLNYVRKGILDAEKYMLSKGFSPLDARKFSYNRVFGGINGNYGTGIMGFVEKGDAWDEDRQIADNYIHNMGATYDGSEDWGAFREGIFEAALQNTEVVVQPRSGNTWGPLSLDHVYEFMGGLNLAVRSVTGEDPSAYFNDFRNVNNPRMQELKEAIGVETNSTVFNPKYIREMLGGKAGAMETFAETFRNTYGWNVMKPEAIDNYIWDTYYDIYINDKHKLDVRKRFEEENPYALQEMSAVMLETARKGYWKATEEQLQSVAGLHAGLIKDHKAGCSEFVCDNAKLREFIAGQLTVLQAEQYQQDIKEAREVRLEEGKKNVVLEKERQKSESREENAEEETGNKGILIISVLLLMVITFFVVKIKKRNA